MKIKSPKSRTEKTTSKISILQLKLKGYYAQENKIKNCSKNN